MQQAPPLQRGLFIHMNTFSLILQPLIAAFTGWFTTWIAIYMLFHPREPKRILGFTIQGIFPKRQKQFAARFGTLVANELLHFNDIMNELKDPAHISGLMPSIEQHIDTFLHTRLQEKIPVVATFMGESTLKKIKDSLVEEIELMLPDVITQYTDSLSEKVDVGRIVTAKIETFSSDRLEQLLLSVMTKEFRFVELIGGVLGFLIGLIQLAISLL